MAKKKNNKSGNWPNSNTNQNSNQNQSKAELLERMKADRIEAAIRDDRFEEIVKDYEAFKEELKRKHEEEKLNLQAELDQKLKGLNDEKKLIEQEKENIEKLKENELKKIKDNQETIAEEYYNELIAKSDEKIVEKKKELEEGIKEYERKLQKLKEEHEHSLQSAKLEIEKEYKKHQETIDRELNDLKEKIEEEKIKIEQEKEAFKKEIRTIDRERRELEFQKELMKEEKEGLEILKERYSPQKLIKLQLEYDELKRISEVESERLKEITGYYTNLKARLPGSDAELEIIVAENDNLRKENNEFADRLAQYPSLQEVERLRNDAKMAEMLKDEMRAEARRRQEAEATVESINLSTRELEQARKVAKTLTTLNEQLQNELAEINKMYQASTSSKFQALCEIDQSIAQEEKKKNVISNTTLKELVEYIRNYGAAKENLYYSEKMLRCYLASMASSHMIILQGLSGTGKSSLPRLLGKALNFELGLFPVQPSWRDNRELLGYDNDFTKKFKETEFTKFMYKVSAPQYENNINLAVLDEMNLARVEYYFADFLAILENEVSEWIIPLVPAYDETDESRIPKYLFNKTGLQIKENTWFIGTVNRDESTFGITNKVYDRAMVIDFNEREQAFQGKQVSQITLSYNGLADLFKAACENPKYTMNDPDNIKVKKVDEFLKDKMNITFGNRIEKQIGKYVPVFVASGGSKEEALDYLFAYKVLRQLEDRYEPYLKKGIKELKELINREFGSAFTESMKLLSKKEEQLGG